MRRIFQPLVWALVGAGIAGGVFFLANQTPNAGITILVPSPTPVAPIQAYITGAVSSPGVYTLQPGSRVRDLIREAGGAQPSADMVSINLARRVQDQEQLHVPFSSSENLTIIATPEGRLVNINVAGVDALATLPGIGEGRALAIVEYRILNGSFQRIDELLKVPGIGPITYDGLRDLVTVGPLP